MTAILSPGRLTYAASRCGVTVAEYLRRRATGCRWCSLCKHFRGARAFTTCKMTICRDCRRKHYRWERSHPWQLLLHDSTRPADVQVNRYKGEADARSAAARLNAQAMRTWRPYMRQPPLWFVVGPLRIEVEVEP